MKNDTTSVRMRSGRKKLEDNVLPAGLRRVRPEEAQRAKRCLLFLIFPSIPLHRLYYTINMKYPVRDPSPIAVHGPIAVHSAIFSHLLRTVILPHSGPL